MGDDPKGGDSRSSSTADIEATVQRLLDKKGADQATADLLKDNFKQREEIRERDARIKDLEGKVPGEGAVVLTAEQAKDWEAYQALGKPDAVKATVDKVATLETDIAKRDREKTQKEAADAAGFKPSVLAKLPGADELTYETREEEVDGEKRPVAYVTPKGDGAKPQKLTEYADENWKELLPALAVEAEQPTRNSSSSGGAPFRGQAGDTRPPATKVTDEQVTDTKRKSGIYGGI